MKTGRNRFFAHVSARLQWQADVKKELTVPFINSPPPFSALPRGNASGTDSANQIGFFLLCCLDRLDFLS